MDVRQFAFFVRQPSAALKSRSTFLGLPKRGVALILANAMFWQPLLAQADGIVVSAPGTTLGQAGNGVPIVNIAAPNANGLSHNQFNDYNVGANGVILNNATDRTQSTQLGGIIVGNPMMRAKLSWVATSCWPIREICWKLHQARPAKAINKAPTKAHNGPVLALLTLTTGVLRERTDVAGVGSKSSSSPRSARRLGTLSKSSLASLRMNQP